MDEFTLGLGRQSSIRRVAELANGHISRIEGAPKTIKLRGPGIKVTAERDSLDGDYTRFIIRGRLGDAFAQKLQEKIDETGGYCSIQKDENSRVLVFPAEGKEATPEALEALDQVTALLALPETWRVRGENFRTDRVSIEMLFQALVQYKASDVHLSPGHRPVFRVDGDTHDSEVLPEVSGAQIREIIREMADDRYMEEFDRELQTSFEFHQVGLGFSRVSAFIKGGAPHCTMRFLPEEIPSFEQLNVPPDTMQQLAGLHRGLLLITGMTGSGKSTTAAALVDWINSHRSCHILTIENPIEYVHHNKKSIISQRCLGIDVHTFRRGGERCAAPRPGRNRHR